MPTRHVSESASSPRSAIASAPKSAPEAALGAPPCALQIRIVATLVDPAMNPLRIGTTLILVLAAVLVPGAARSAPASTTLIGTVGVGDAFIIRLTDESGN